jgi:hypothetical protein
MKNNIIIFCLVVLVVVLMVQFILPYCVFESKKENHFLLSKPLRAVKLNILKKDILEEALSMSGSKVLDKEWTGFNLGTSNFRDVLINAKLKIQIEVKDPIYSTLTLDLEQELKTHSDGSVEIHTKLTHPVKHLHKLETTTLIKEKALLTEVNTQSLIVIKTRMLKHLIPSIQNQIDELNIENLKNIELCFSRAANDPNFFIKIK